MAVLNKIRQRSLFLILIIALALFSFVLADLFRNSDALSARSQDTIATINGKDVKRDDFLQKVENMQRQMGPNATNTQVMNRVWDQEVRQAVYANEYEKLGLTVEKDQMRDLIKQYLSSTPEFLNEAGVFDENKLNEFIANLKEIDPQPGFLNGQPLRYSDWLNYEKSIANSGLQTNYNNLIKAGLVGTLTEGELAHKLEGDKVDLKYVQVPYSSIADSTITVSKSDISNYINSHKKEFEVEASRDLKYVEFKEVASVKDENDIKAILSKYKKGFTERNERTNKNETILPFSQVKDHENYVNVVAGSDTNFDKRFVFKSSLPKSVADTLYKLDAGAVYGPYRDGDLFKLTKIVEVKQIPDSAKVRHILIPFKGARSATPEITQTENEAKTTADSLLKVIKADKSKFPELVKAFSSDKGSVEKEGRYDWHPYNTMVPEFNEFEFEGKVGDLGIVKTIFGFHIIEIEGQKDKKKAVKVATISRKIEPSEETINKIFRDASNFEISAKDKDFETLAKESNYNIRPVNGIKALDETIPGIGNQQRPIVRWTFEEDAKVGDVKRFTIPNGYAIVQLVKKHKKGLMTPEDASATVLPKLRKEFKAKQIKERIKASNLQDVATAEKTTVRTASAVNMKNPTISGAGREPLVVGTAFALKEGETSKLIAGEKGVYIVEVTKITPAVALDNYQSFANQVERQKAGTVTTKLYNALKEASDIEDNRAKLLIQ